MNKDEFVKFLKSHNACGEATKWIDEKSSTLEQLWNNCSRGDWMLWLLAELQADRKKIVMSACQCARLTLHLADGPEARIAIATAEAWCRDEATSEEAGKAAWAAWDAEAARAAAWAAWAAEAARAARTAAWAAAAAARAAGAAEATTLKQCADIVRLNFEFSEILELLNKEKEYDNERS